MFLFTATSTNTSPTLTFSTLQMPKTAFALPQTITCVIYKNGLKKTEFTITWSTVSTLTSTSGSNFPATISDSLVAPYNLGINMFSIALTSVSTSNAADEIKVGASAGSFLACYVSSYFCSIRGGNMYIKPQNPSG